MALISKRFFETRFRVGGEELPDLGDVVPVDRYLSTAARLDQLTEGDALFLVTVRPGDALWLVAILDSPQKHDDHWSGTPNQTPITDITHLIPSLQLGDGRGLTPKPGRLGMSLQTARFLAPADVTTLRAAPPDPSPQQPPVAPVEVTLTQQTGHAIEEAKTGRSRCQTCEEKIEKGALRLAESYVSHRSRNLAVRYHHLECAADSRPHMVSQALGECTLELPDLDALRARVERALASAGAISDDTIRAEYARFARSVVALSDTQTDEHALVFADWLQGKADPRGELIVCQHQLAQSPSAELDRRAQRLLATHRKALVPEIVDKAERVTWRCGFLHEVVISEDLVTREMLEQALRHPSSSALRSLSIERRSLDVAANLPPLSPSLRHVGLIAPATPPQMRRPVTGPIQTATHLETLHLVRAHDLDGLSHPCLTALHLDLDPFAVGVVAPGLAGLSEAGLPGLDTLCIRRLTDEEQPDRQTPDWPAEQLLTALGRAEVLHSIRRLVLCLPLPPPVVAQLVALLETRDRTIPGLDISRCSPLGSSAVEALRPLCEQLTWEEVKPPRTSQPPSAEWRVQHVRRPEWGVGVVIDETAEGLVIEFENAGTRTIRGRKLIVDVD
jgi:uncharacterized protein (TIGR02996 family)